MSGPHPSPSPPRRRAVALAALLAALAAPPACGGDGVSGDPDADAPVDTTDTADAVDTGDTGPGPGPGDRPPCQPTDLAERLGAGAWDTRFTIAGVTGIDGYTPGVHGLALGPDGSLLVAGYYRWVGADRVGPLARLRDGSWEAAGAGLPTDSLSAVAVADDGRVAVSTYEPLLPTPGGPAQSGTIFLAEPTGSAPIGSFTGIVRRLLWVDGALWVAGHFLLEGTELYGLAVWRDGEWEAPPGGVPDGPVYALLAEEDRVVVGGSFTRIGGIDAQSVATWEPGGWTARSLTGFEPSEAEGAFRGPVVYGLARDGGGVLHVGGVLFRADDWTTGGVARWEGESWELVGSGFAMSGGFAGDFPGIVSDLALHDGMIYATGCITRTGGDGPSTPLPQVARWNGAAWEAPPGTAPGHVGSVWYHDPYCGGEPSGTSIMESNAQVLLSDGERLYLGGQLPGMGEVASKGLVAFDGSGWSAVGDTSGLGLAGSASQIAVGGPECAVHVFGPTHGGAVAGGPIMRFDGDSWAPVAAEAAWPEGVSCGHLTVDAEGTLYLGCSTPFDLDSMPAPRVYRLEEGAWVALPWREEVEGTVWGMTADPAGRLWIYGGLGVDGYVAWWDEDALAVNPGFDGTVFSVAFGPHHGESQRDVLVGGAFTHAGDGTPARGIARWDGAVWTAFGAGLGSGVLAIAMDGDTLYASTAFQPGEDGATLARWDGATWEELGVPERGLPPHINPTGRNEFRSLLALDGVVIATGSAYPVTGGRVAFVFVDETFEPLGGGVGAISAEGFAATPSGLWFGGFVATTGHGDTLAPSVGIAHFELGASGGDATTATTTLR